MTSTVHGMSVGIERSDNLHFVSIKAFGTLTHHDYQVMTPMLESALANAPEQSVLALMDISEFNGWEIRAAWDDFKLGVKHGKEFKKIAIVGNKNWQELASKVAGWFIRGEVKSFTDMTLARQWLLAG